MWLSTHSILLRATRKYVLCSFPPSASHVSRRCYAIVPFRAYDVSFFRPSLWNISHSLYQDAVELLNTLQTPYKVLKERWDSGVKPDETSNQEMRRCLKLIGYSVFLLPLSLLQPFTKKYLGKRPKKTEYSPRRRHERQRLNMRLRRLNPLPIPQVT
jgi:hypothetical protein